jgi:hypothetical protein
MVRGTARRVAGSALITAGFTLAGLEVFTLVWQRGGAASQYELIARGGDILLIILPAILLVAVTLTLIIVWRLTRYHTLSLAQRVVLPVLAAALTGYVATSLLALWVLIPVGLVSLPLREVITWLLVAGAVWIGIRLVREAGRGTGATA